jgi:hypothetical protein
LSSNKDYIEITWDDNSTDEIGYRIDKKVGATGNWGTLVYRPRKDNVSPTATNELVWRDYMPARGEDNYYRVVAINCDDLDGGASSATSPILVDDVLSDDSQLEAKEDILVYPNPAVNELHIAAEQIIKSVEIFNLSGLTILNFDKIEKRKLSTPIALRKGIYIMQISLADGTSFNKKMLVK